MRSLAFHRPQSGDTIVEVMIAIALLASVLFSAYAIANDSARLGMAAREQDQSTQLLQHQAEGLRHLRQQSDDWDSFTDQVEGPDFYVQVVGGEWEVENGRGDGHDIIGDSYPDERFTTWSQVETDPGVEDKEEIVIYVRWNTITGQVQTATLDTVLANTDPLPPPDVLPGESESPDTPVNLTATAAGSDSISLNWDQVVDPDAESYNLRRNGSDIGSTSFTGYTDNSLDPSTEYTYRVQASNQSGESGWSAPASATTAPESIEETFTETSTGRSGSIQQWTVPENGSYRITAFGAQGGGPNGGRGARMSGIFTLNEGDELTILVGQQGGNNSGGGGTFVMHGNNPLVIAGGGGGGGDTGVGQHGTVSTSGTDDSSGNNAGGTDGDGGQIGGDSGSSGFAGSGAGLDGDGRAYSWYQPPEVAYAFQNGGEGGEAGGDSDGWGGFGGGGGGYEYSWGAAGGGGGGYSGGAGGYRDMNINAGGGGGGSLNNGTSPSNAAGDKTGHGRVEVESTW